MLSFAYWAHAQEDTITDAMLDNLSLADLARFSLRSTSTSVTPSPGLTTQFSTTTRDTALEFSKGIKKDPSQYDIFTKDAEWLSWNAHLHALAATHGVSNVLDPDYEPAPEDSALFKVQQDFLFSVFHRCLKSPSSKKYVRTFENTRDAQAVYSSLLKEFSNNAHVKIRVKKLTKDLNELSLDSNWTRSLESFFNVFENRILDLEKVSGESCSDEKKQAWLESAIMGHPELNGSYSAAMAALAAGSGDTIMPYQKMFDMLKYLAISIDDKVGTAKRKTRKTNKTQLDKDKNKSEKTIKSDKAWRLPREQWLKMSFEERTEHMKKFGKKYHLPKRRANATDIQKPTPSPAPATPPTTESAPSASTPEPGSLLRTLLSNSTRQSSSSNEITINGRTFREVNSCRQYRVHQSLKDLTGALVDGGCNGGLGGDDVRILDTTSQQVDVHGIADSTICSVPIGTAAAFIGTSEGPIIGIFHQYALYGKGKTIHSANQLRAFGNLVDDVPLSLKGTQRIVTHDGYKIPLAIRNGLAYMDMRPPTDEELEAHPHVTFTYDDVWDPESLDQEADAVFEAHDNSPDLVDGEHEAYETAVVPTTEERRNGEEVDKTESEQTEKTEIIKVPRKIVPKAPDYNILRPYFNWASIERIKSTLDNTTQWFRASAQQRLKHHFKTRFPAANVPRWNEDVATDTIFSDVPAHDDGIPGHGGCTMLQLYTGIQSHLTEGFPIKSESQISNTLADLIRMRGAPNNLKSDNAKAILGDATQEILRQYCIGSKYSEPHQQNQNPAERRIQDVKADTNKLMDRTGTPAKYWLLCMLYVIFLSNHTAFESLSGRTPL